MPNIHTHTFPNGFRVIYERPTSPTEITHVDVFCRAGSVFEPESLRGVSHFIEHMCFKGTKRRPTTRDIFAVYDNIGAYFNAYTEKQFTCYVASFLNSHTNQCVDTLGDMMLRSKFDKREYKKELNVVLEENVRNLTDYSNITEDIAESLIYKGSSYAYPIDSMKYHKIVDSWDYDDVMAFYHKHYVPENMMLSIVTTIPFSTILKIIKSCHFAKFDNHRDNNLRGKPLSGYSSNTVATQERRRSHTLHSRYSRKTTPILPIMNNIVRTPIMKQEQGISVGFPEITGDCENAVRSDKLRDKLHDKLRDKLRGRCSRNNRTWNPIRTRIELIPISNIQTAYMSIGIRTCSRFNEDKYALELLRILMGGKFTSRLTMLLREQNGLTYTSSVSTTHYEHSGDISIFCITDSANILRNNKLTQTRSNYVLPNFLEHLPRCVRCSSQSRKSLPLGLSARKTAKNRNSSYSHTPHRTLARRDRRGVFPIIMDMLRDLIRHGITDTELRETKMYMAGITQMNMAKGTKQAEYNGLEWFLGNDEQITPYGDLYKTKYEDITKTEINRVIRNYFTLENTNIVMVGSRLPDKKHIEKLVNGVFA